MGLLGLEGLQHKDQFLVWVGLQIKRKVNNYPCRTHISADVYHVRDVAKHSDNICLCLRPSMILSAPLENLTFEHDNYNFTLEAVPGALYIRRA